LSLPLSKATPYEDGESSMKQSSKKDLTKFNDRLVALL